jgi:hypothetical protein
MGDYLGEPFESLATYKQVLGRLATSVMSHDIPPLLSEDQIGAGLLPQSYSTACPYDSSKTESQPPNEPSLCSTTDHRPMQRLPQMPPPSDPPMDQLCLAD